MAVDESLHPLFREIKDLRDQARHAADLKGGSGDGTSGGVTEEWKASVDRQLGQLHGDVRALLNRGVIAVVALAGMIGGQYFYFNTKFEAADRRMAAVEAKLEKLEGKIDTRSAELAGKLDVLLERKANREGRPE